MKLNVTHQIVLFKYILFLHNWSYNVLIWFEMISTSDLSSYRRLYFQESLPILARNVPGKKFTKRQN